MVNQIAAGVLSNNAQTQGTVTAGIRYDIKPTVSLKAPVGSYPHGRLCR